MNTLTALHIGSNYAVPQHQKDAESERIAALMREFEANGGVIEKLAWGERTPLDQGRHARSQRKAFVINPQKAGGV